MKFPNLKGVFLLILVLIFAINSQATTPRGSDEKDIEREIERLLLKRDVSDLANELAQKKSARTTTDLLINLSVFARAGHRLRVHETLKEIAKDFSSSPNQTQTYNVARKAIGKEDLT
ncbi:MAG: hypothetical protein LC768_00560, partial [Acidobacteria bacterium]|nr:hypothetical protein [Acidobacteriota bacterium]